MATDLEKQLLKEFLDGLDTNKLCDIARSVYRGGGIRVNTREDAEVLLISQPYSRILCSRKTPQTNVLKFLICKGLTPQPDMTKGDLCLAFKTLIESHPNYIRPSVQPVQSIQSMQMMPAASNMLALSQNNNMMHVPPYQSHMQQMSVVAPITSSTVPSTKAARKDRENELLEEFIEMFAKHFYELLNDLGIPGKNQLDGRYFYENCTMVVKILGGSEEVNENCADSSSILQCLLDIKKQHQLYFAPHLGDGVKWKKESHGLLKVHIGGTLHQGVGRMVGMFEQQFILREDPQAENTWKILNTNLMMKSMDTMISGSTLSIQGSQTNYLQIDSA